MSIRWSDECQTSVSPKGRLYAAWIPRVQQIKDINLGSLQGNHNRPRPPRLARFYKGLRVFVAVATSVTILCQSLTALTELIQLWTG